MAGGAARLRPQGVEQQLAGARAQQVHGGRTAEGGPADTFQRVGLQLQAAPEGDHPQPVGGSGGHPRGRVCIGVVAEGELPRAVRPGGTACGPTGHGPACPPQLQRAPRGLPQHLEHAVRALGAGRGRGVVQRCRGTVDERADRADGDLALLAEGREHAFGVRHEQRGRGDDQDAARVPATVLVEEVGGAVQGHGRLPRSRTALDIRHRGGGGADDQVLLGLDGGHDVPHGVAAGLAEGGHEGAVADDGQLVPAEERLELGAHEVVLDAQHAAALGPDDPAPYDPPRIDRGGAVERRRGRGPPVDDQRGVVLVEHTDTADVQRLGDVGGVVRPDRALGGLDGGVRAVGSLLSVLAGQQVDPAEEEVLELVVEPVEVDARPEDLRVPLGECAGRTDLAALGRVVHEELRLVDLLLEPSVHLVQVYLFDADLPVSQGVFERGFLWSLSGHRAPF